MALEIGGEIAAVEVVGITQLRIIPRKIGLSGPCGRDAGGTGEATVGSHVGIDRNGELSDVGGTDGLAGFASRFAKGGEQDGDEERDNGDDNEKFNQRERSRKT